MESQSELEITTQRSDPYSAQLIRLGITALPIGGLLKLGGQFGTFTSVGYGVPDATAAAATSSSGYVLGMLLGAILPVVLGIFGVLALFGYLLPTSARRLATVAMVCCVTGSALILPALGVLSYALPALGEAYLSGHPEAFAVAGEFFTFPRVAIFFPALLVPIGGIIFAVAIWQTQVLPRWAGVLFAISGLLLSFPLPIHTLRLLGGIGTVVAGFAIAVAMRRAALGRCWRTPPAPHYDNQGR